MLWDCPVFLSLASTCKQTIGVDVEGDFDLRYGAWGGCDAGQLKGSQQFVIGCQCALALEDFDLDGRLIVGGRRKDLWRRVGIVVLRSISGAMTLPRVAIPSVSGVTSSSSTSLTSPDKHGRLDRRAERDDFVGIDAFVRIAAEHVLDCRLNGWHARLTADQDHLIDVAGLQIGIFERLTDRRHRRFDQIRRQAVRVWIVKASSASVAVPMHPLK